MINRTILSTIFLAGLIFQLVSCKKDSETESTIFPDRDNGGISLPPNFGAVVVVDTLGRGRFLTVRDNGDLYVHLRRLNHEGYGIVALRDTDGDARADIIRGYTDITGTGIRIHNGYLYYSNTTQVFRSRLTEGELLPEAQRDTIVTLVEGIGHMEKPFTFDGAGNIYVNVGSMSNCCEEKLRTGNSPGDDPCVELETRAGIWKFLDGQTGQVQDLSKRYATGIRNAVALSWNNEVNRLFALQHGRDDLHRYWPDFFTEEQNLELPSEIFFDLEEGDNMGWPYCYYDHLQNAHFLNPEYGGDGNKTDRCENVKMPLMGFPGHWGPNDLLFYKGSMFPEKYRNGAFVAFHGSWNRLGHEQQGFKVVFIPMKDGKPSGNYEVFADGFIGPEPITNPADAYFRPCGLAEGPDGSLYMVDSQHGRVWRIFYYPDGIAKYEDRPLFRHGETGQEILVAESLKEGKAVYDMYCLACHMPNGLGAPGMNPPLVATDWVVGDKTRLIKVVLNGLNDPIEINGEKYQNVMAPHSFLSDKQIADVLTFIRQTWGNQADPVTQEEVKKVRSQNN